MARSKYPLAILILSFLLAPCKSQTFSTKLSAKTILDKPEKLTHIHFYFHDIVSGRNPTAVRVAQSPATKNSPFLFGAVVMIDDPLTVSPDPNSKMVGRAQGIYASAAQTEIGFLMAMTYAFTEGKYNGSNLSILGRNPPLSEMREMPIVGGSGLFRFARGYAQARTHTFNFTTGDACVEYNVYVLHY